MKKRMYLALMSLAVMIMMVMAAVPHHHHHGLWCHMTHIGDLYSNISEIYEIHNSDCSDIHDLNNAEETGLCEDGCSEAAHNDGEAHNGCVEDMTYVTSKTSVNAPILNAHDLFTAILPTLFSELLTTELDGAHDYNQAPQVFYNTPEIGESNSLRAPPACRV